MDCAVRLESTDVSRKHARIMVDEAGATVEDLGSTNGTFVRGQRISAPVKLTGGMTVAFGSTEAIFHDSPEEPRTEIR